jgi:uncharacterized XkdX family phage protein
MTDFQKVKMFYDNGWATKDQVKIYVQYNKITTEEYQIITGDKYIAA